MIGQTLGQYQIIEQIGRGGMATVFKAYQPSLDRYVALKLLPPIYAQQPDFRERFRREAKTIANLNHPHILPVFDFGQEGEYSFLTMRYITEAHTLKRVMNDTLKLAQVSDLMTQIAAALDVAHQQGIIHRDVKPSNILMDGDWALLADFGLAKMTESSVKLTGTGVGIGTPAYMSPEQGQGLTVDHRTDIYALGIILFEMLTRQIPYKAETPFGIILKRATEPLPLPRSLNPQISEAIERVVLKALAPKPKNRFDSAGAMVEALKIAINESASEILSPVGEKSPTMLSPAIVTPKLVKQSQKGAAEATLGQKIANLLGGGSDDSRDQRNRQTMLDLVYDFWIKGVLENSLHGAALIDLGLEARPEAVDHPWQMVLQSSDLSQLAIPSGTKMIDIFNELKRSLLILGEPGSGKTTMLLELARDLISRAKQDPTQPIPIVFNLSSWAEPQPPLDEWLVKELNSKYHIPKKIAQQWLDDEALMPLLDGLDEVAQSHRAACVEAINLFHKESMQPLIVCSRIADYEALATKLGLQQAICLQALNEAQIEAYLSQFGPALSPLKRALQNDSNLQELAQSPLILSVMSLSYTGDTELTPTNSVETQRQHIFERYVTHMLTRRGAGDYSDNKTQHWLSWLAQEMMGHSQTMFLLERLQPSWLPAKNQKLNIWLSFVVPLGLLIGLLTGVWAGMIGSEGLVNGLYFGSMAGLIVILLLGLRLVFSNWQPEIMVSEVSIRPKNMLRDCLFLLPAVPLIGLMFGLMSGPLFGLIMGLLIGLIGLAFVPVGGLLKKPEVVKTSLKPNQGIWAALKNGLIIGLGGGLFYGLLFGLSGGLFGILIDLYWWDSGANVFGVGLVGLGLLGPIFGLLFGLLGLFLGLVIGLIIILPFIQHFVLRFLLYRRDTMPWHYVRFLDYATERIFLRKVGGGYIFIHRYLLEYFAGLSKDTNTRKI